ncbi:MAG: anion transporter, partial [Chlamydiia bacterium]|nr:anion transporter [Chlamydiia bacterium]
MSLALLVLLLVFLGIALRQVFRIPLKIWQIMGAGAALVLFTGKISLMSAWASIDWSIIFFLWGMFVLGQALEESGYLSEFVARFLGSQCSPRKLVAIIVFGMGLFSAILMNDTL